MEIFNGSFFIVYINIFWQKTLLQILPRSSLIFFQNGCSKCKPKSFTECNHIFQISGVNDSFKVLCLYKGARKLNSDG